MTTARKAKTAKAVYGRQATSAEQARFKKFATEDIKRDENRLAADVKALKNFVTILKSGKGFGADVAMVTGTGGLGSSMKKSTPTTKTKTKTKTTVVRSGKASAAGAKR
ncbi:hypothetical protein [Cupriavidus nantongensis]|uniref:hypothetical protein n=1 Tax=Cupriavidus nantongensis TaxID=1796606 RepID=UPI00358F39FC